MKVKNDDIEKKNIEQEIQLEEIAKIVESNMHVVDDDLPEYDGYDVPEYDEDVYINEGNVKNSPKHKKENKRENKKEKKVEPSKEENSTEQTVISRVEKEQPQAREVVAGDPLKRRYTTVELIMGIAVISIICSSGIGVLGELPAFLAFSKWNGISFGDLGLPLLLASVCFMIPTEVELDVKRKKSFKEICIKKVKVGIILFVIGILINLILLASVCFMIPTEVELDVKRKKSFKEICIKKVKVGIILFVIGILINLIGAWNFNSFRVMGILQMIAIVYMVGSLLYVLFRRFNFKISVIAVFLTAIGIVGLVGYYVAGANFGDTAKTCLAYFVDSKVMPGHIGDFERYGIMSTVSALCGGCLAVAAGSFLCNKRVENRDKSNKILIMGMFFVIIALLLERNCPYNASVMSPSFVMIVLGGYCVAFAALFGIFDLNRSKTSHLVSLLCNRRVENRDKSNKILIMGMFFVIIALLMERNCPYNASVMSPSFVMIVLGGYCVAFAALFGIFDLNRSKTSHLVSRPFVVMGASPVFVVGLNEFIKNTLFKINVYSVAMGTGLKLDEWIVIDTLSEIFGDTTRMIAFLVMYLLLIFVLMLYLYAKRIYIRFK